MHFKTSFRRWGRAQDNGLKKKGGAAAQSSYDSGAARRRAASTSFGCAPTGHAPPPGSGPARAPAADGICIFWNIGMQP
eukprot:CAMPEP_0204112158 /NCGR_PEP_ID=MMETSP0361-20130328/2888_1 /ASSEMBLY_ACC=CAM_ASM_000343 /TAXON_ID=268821 /ORGANISM="Scrippsiella Hangoei, Strain SHTV-5" /LENGTH=78 /DNA_ID=CAMNT_0051062313 /DNA_START=47 /DNA_END=283 /DNA_ORIENTATION=+